MGIETLAAHASSAELEGAAGVDPCLARGDITVEGRCEELILSGSLLR